MGTGGMVRVMFSLRQADLDKIMTESKLLGIKRSEWLRRLLDEYFGRDEDD